MLEKKTTAPVPFDAPPVGEGPFPVSPPPHPATANATMKSATDKTLFRTTRLLIG